MHPIFHAIEPIQSPPTCFHHKDRQTGRACTRCGRPACADCLHDAPVGSHCWQCIKAAQPPMKERARRWNATAGALVTRVIIALNIGVFVLTALTGGAMGRGGELQFRLALFGPAVAAGEWYRLVTSGFVHYGILHIAFNMLILARFGQMLEPALGRARMTALYLSALLTGSLGVVLMEPTGVTAGASGAVFGLVGAAAVGLRQRGINVWQSGIGPLLAINLVFTFAVPGISIGGHLGGLIGGVVVGGVMLRAPDEPRPVVEGLLFALAVSALAFGGAVWAAGN
ncbi:MAG: rhomboid family intramembrane serine protease [Acidimicrobiia bacterium]